MKNFLTEGSAVLAHAARARMLLVFDYDGTLAPIVDDRSKASLSPSTRRLLRLTSLLYPCAVLSGRSRSDLLSRVEGVTLVAAIGNHGAEAGFGPVRRSLRNAVAGWKAVIEERVRGLPGVEIEDKGFSIAVHYRRAPARGEARRAVRAAMSGLEGARVFGGHAVVNVVPADAQNKGAAIAELVARMDSGRALYVGDDITDEDAFRSGAVAVGVRVGRTRRSGASYYLPGQADIDALLRALVCARRRLDGLDENVEALQSCIESVVSR